MELGSRQLPSFSFVDSLPFLHQHSMKPQQEGSSPSRRGSSSSDNEKASSSFERYQLALRQNQLDRSGNTTHPVSSRDFSESVEETTRQMSVNSAARVDFAYATQAPICRLTGRPPIQLYLTADCTSFSPYQLFVRKNIEFFESTEIDVETKAKNRSRPIVLGQVGMRCRFCNSLHASLRTPGSIVYPLKKTDIYQSAQNIVNSHWTSGNCVFLPMDQRATFEHARSQRSSQRAPKATWRDRATALGVFEDEYGLRFADSVNAFGFPSNDLKEVVEKLLK